MADSRHFENRYIAISQRKIIRFSWNFVQTSRFWTRWTSRDQKWKKVALDRLRVRQNVFYNVLYGCWTFTLTYTVYMLFYYGQKCKSHVKSNAAILRFLSVLSVRPTPELWIIERFICSGKVYLTTWYVPICRRVKSNRLCWVCKQGWGVLKDRWRTLWTFTLTILTLKLFFFFALSDINTLKIVSLSILTTLKLLGCHV